jgi:hypothetical protein
MVFLPLTNWGKNKTKGFWNGKDTKWKDPGPSHKAMKKIIY